MAVTPTDTGPALVALDAEMEVRSAGGVRMVPAENFFIGPSTDITRMTVMEPTDLLVAIHVPGRWAGSRMYFEKVADRGSWDFALGNVASALDVQSGTIFEARIVVGGWLRGRCGCAGWRMRSRGGRSMRGPWRKRGRLAVEEARPLQFNAYKIALTRNLVKRAIREATA